MALVTGLTVFQNGTTADATAVNANFNAIVNDHNGNITDANIAASGITTYGKVDGGAIKNLGSIAVGAGTIPVANIPSPLNQSTTGTASNVTGTVAIANGGTGQVTAQAAVDALLPAQGAASGKFLTTNGTNSSWGGGSSTWGSRANMVIDYGNNLVQTAATEHSMTGHPGAWTKVKEVVVPYSGGLRVDLDFYNSAGSPTDIQYYRNGVSIDSFSASYGSYTTTTRNLSGFTAGDLLQVYYRSGDNTSYMKNLKIYTLIDIGSTGWTINQN